MICDAKLLDHCHYSIIPFWNLENRSGKWQLAVTRGGRLGEEISYLLICSSRNFRRHDPIWQTCLKWCLHARWLTTHWISTLMCGGLCCTPEVGRRTCVGLALSWIRPAWLAESDPTSPFNICRLAEKFRRPPTPPLPPWSFVWQYWELPANLRAAVCVWEIHLFLSLFDWTHSWKTWPSAMTCPQIRWASGRYSALEISDVAKQVSY